MKASHRIPIHLFFVLYDAIYLINVIGETILNKNNVKYAIPSEKYITKSLKIISYFVVGILCLPCDSTTFTKVKVHVWSLSKDLNTSVQRLLMSLKTQFFHKSVAGKSFVLLSDEQFWPLNVVKLIWWRVKKVGSFMLMEQAIAKAPYLLSSRQKNPHK